MGNQIMQFVKMEVFGHKTTTIKAHSLPFEGPDPAFFHQPIKQWCTRIRGNTTNLERSRLERYHPFNIFHYVLPVMKVKPQHEPAGIGYSALMQILGYSVGIA